MGGGEDEKSVIARMVDKVNSAVENIVNNASAAAMQSMEQTPRKTEQPIASLPPAGDGLISDPLLGMPPVAVAPAVPKPEAPKKQPGSLRRESHPPGKPSGSPPRRQPSQPRRNRQRGNRKRPRKNTPAKKPQKQPRKNRPTRLARRMQGNRSADAVAGIRISAYCGTSLITGPLTAGAAGPAFGASIF